MELADDKIRGLKWSLFFICVAIGAILFGLVFTQAKYSRAVSLKNMQVNSLIDEVGILQEENFGLSIALEQEQQKSAGIKKEILNLSNYLGILDQTKEGLFETQEDLDKVRQHLAAELGEQGQQIQDITAMNQVLLDELNSLVEYPDAILDLLILGTHGALTDTIMIASVNPSLKTITFLSVPRDFYVNGRKINEVYNRYGVEKLIDVLWKITGVKIDKYVVVDLQSFISAVDTLGGLDIHVPEDLYDPMYPGPNYTYTVFSIGKGQHQMNGTTALKYARSRKTTSDFDRAERQQQILEAFRSKLLALNLLNDINKAIKIGKQILADMDTDLDAFETVGWLDKYQDYQFEKGNVLSTANFLYSTYNQRGQYILLPNDSTYKEIREYVGDLILK